MARIIIVLAHGAAALTTTHDSSTDWEIRLAQVDEKKP